ncbi:hypothetical protein CWC29_009775 [Pseudoalteromonas sp. S4498]|uniref:hypothetical protein n=1 Tax=Pseudoalteromonas galatheae TaxID=579562 RepID=UPI00110873C9|nr:hypothetical protein [Pseudoalteromonas galatheae]NKC19125.1 hypothetical protein [Pseudoalteromonas galatheae]
MNLMEWVQATLPELMSDHEIKPASAESLVIFTAKATVQLVPNEVIAQLVSFYAHLAEVPCLDSLVVHHCDDPIIFEWWGDKELWLGSKDFYVLRWSAEKACFCIGDVSNVSFGEDEEFPDFNDAVIHLATL